MTSLDVVMVMNVDITDTSISTFVKLQVCEILIVNRYKNFFVHIIHLHVLIAVSIGGWTKRLAALYNVYNISQIVSDSVGLF